MAHVQILCKTYYFVQAMSYTASVCILTVISLERFVAIIYPMHSRRLHSMLLLRVTIVAVWTVAAASGLPYVYIYDTIDMPASGQQFCIVFHWFDVRGYTCATFVLWYVLPLVMMAFVYSRISVVLWRSSHGPPGVMSASPSRTLRSATPSTFDVRQDACSVPVAQSQRDDVEEASSSVKCVVMSADSPVISTGPDDTAGGRLIRSLGFLQRRAVTRQDHLTSPPCLITVERSSDDAGHDSCVELHSLTTGRETGRQFSAALTANSDHSALGARRKVIRLLIAVIISFAVCVLPYHVRLLWQAFFSDDHQLTDWHLLIPPITFVLYYLNSGLNPILYAFLSNKFRSSLSDVLCCRCKATTHVARVNYDVGWHVTTNTRTARTGSVY